MDIVRVCDLLMLHDYFSRKQEPSAEDKKRAESIDLHICCLVDGLQFVEMVQKPKPKAEPEA